MYNAISGEQKKASAANETAAEKKLIESTANYNIDQANKSAADILAAAGLTVDGSGNVSIGHLKLVDVPRVGSVDISKPDPSTYGTLVADLSNPLFSTTALGQLSRKTSEVSGGIKTGLASGGVAVGSGTEAALQEQTAATSEADIASLTKKATDQYQYYLDAAKQIKKNARISSNIADLKLQDFNLSVDTQFVKGLFDEGANLAKIFGANPDIFAGDKQAALGGSISDYYLAGVPKTSYYGG